MWKTLQALKNFELCRHLQVWRALAKAARNTHPAFFFFQPFTDRHLSFQQRLNGGEEGGYPPNFSFVFLIKYPNYCDDAYFYQQRMQWSYLTGDLGVVPALTQRLTTLPDQFQTTGYLLLGSLGTRQTCGAYVYRQQTHTENYKS